MAHIIANGIVPGHASSEFGVCINHFQKARSIFINSLERRSEYKNFLLTKPIDDGQAVDEVLDNLTIAQAEDVLKEPLMKAYNYEGVILSVLKKAVGLNTYPPKYMECM